MKLSSFQLKTLKCIFDHGGQAIAEGGGYWKGKDDVRLLVEPEPNAASGIVGTKTIYALESRALLKRVDARSSHLATRCLTQAGFDIINQEEN